MWKRIVGTLILIFGASQLFRDVVPTCDLQQVVRVMTFSLTKEAKAPQLPSDQYWGPGKPGKVDESIRPFKIDVPKTVIDDLKARLERTKTLRKPLEGAGWSYGVDTDYIQTVLEYWRTKYDWTKRQTLLNRYPQFKTNIQGLDIHFYHVKLTLPKDRSVRVLPLLLVHGWPGSVVEFQKIIPLLTIPRPDHDFVFELIVPSLPGYGFSDAAVRPGLGSAQITIVMKNLMDRLGFKKFYTQGGDWGAMIGANMAVLFPSSVLGTHSNMCYCNTPSSNLWTIIGAYIPSLVVSDEHWSKMYPLSYHLSRILEESGYMHLQASKPDTVGTALTDSPAGLAAYILEKFSTWTNPKYRFSQDGNLLKKITVDELLDNLMVYWVTNSITTSMRLCAESLSKAHMGLNLDDVPIRVPSACAVFPYELRYQSETVLKPRYPNLVQVNHMPRGGHFAAFEEPQLLADDVWSFVTLVEANTEAEKNAKKKEL